MIDDDPTGSQTVHSCPLLLRWDVDSLRRGLRHRSSLLFVLANTRALPPEEAAQRNREIVDALQQALEAEAIPESELLLVSRGDSTLRGHGVLEPAVLAEELEARFGPVDATLHVPAFLPGGRTTVDGVHLLHGEPVHTTPFARIGCLVSAPVLSMPGLKKRVLEQFRRTRCCAWDETCLIVRSTRSLRAEKRC